MQVIDYEVLRELAGMSDSGSGFLLEVMERFASDARGSLERIRECARAGEAGLLAREAHRLKGTSGTVGAVALAGACREMERCARAGNCTGMEATVDRALSLLDVTHGYIAEFFRGNIATA